MGSCEESIPSLRTLYDKENGLLQTAGLTAGLVIMLYILFMQQRGQIGNIVRTWSPLKNKIKYT